MPARLPTAWLLLAALCGAAWCVSTGAAKPPDLPIREEITCGPLLFGSGVIRQLPAVEEEDNLHARAREVTALRTAGRCLLFAAHPLLGLLPLEAWLDVDEDEAPAAAPVPAPSRPTDGVTCPYLLEKASREQAAVPTVPVPGSVLENLEKLEQAARVYREAGEHRRAGQFDDARTCYESIRRLCPGSHWDRLANQQLQILRGRHAEEGTGEEESNPPGKESAVFDAQGDYTSRGLACQVAALLEQSHQAEAAGQHDEGEMLAWLAYDLDPARVATLPLFWEIRVASLLRRDWTDWRLRGFIFSSYGPGEEPEDLLRQYVVCFKDGRYGEAWLYALRAWLAQNPLDCTLQAAVSLAAKRGTERSPLPEPEDCPWWMPCGGLGCLFENLNQRFSDTEGSITGSMPHAPPVAELMGHFQALLRQGLYTEAELCALQALALDPDNRAALVAARLAAAQAQLHAPATEPAPCPWAGEPPADLRQPEPPRVDPGVAGAMETILTTACDEEQRGITVTVEEQGEPPATAASAPSTPAAGWVEWARQSQALTDLVDALRSAACIELDCLPFCSKGRCHVALGGVVVELSWSESDNPHSTLTLFVGVAAPE